MKLLLDQGLPRSAATLLCQEVRRAKAGGNVRTRRAYVVVALRFDRMLMLTAFARWFEEYFADAWDRRIEADILAGRLDEAGRRADADFEAGRCRPL